MEKNFSGLRPSYKGDGRGHVVRREIRSDQEVYKLPKKEAGEIVAWMRLKRTTKVYVTFIWTGDEWLVHSVK